MLKCYDFSCLFFDENNGETTSIFTVVAESPVDAWRSLYVLLKPVHGFDFLVSVMLITVEK